MTEIGDAVIVYPTASEYADHIGKQAIVVRELGDDERDLDEVGRMFEVEFSSDGFVLQVFEDELR